MQWTVGQQEAIERYVATGESGILQSEWPGGAVEGGRRAARDLTDALLAEVERRAGGRRPPAIPDLLKIARFTRAKVAPMVRGLFPPGEREAVLHGRAAGRA